MFLWLPLRGEERGFFYHWDSPGKSLYCNGEDIFPFIQVMNSLVARMLSLEGSLLCSVMESSAKIVHISCFY